VFGFTRARARTRVYAGAAERAASLHP